MWEFFKLILILSHIIFAKCNMDKSEAESKSYCSFDLLRRDKLLPSLDGFVGIGWDGLQNKRMLSIFVNNFSKCRTTPDGDFLIPDEAQVLSVKELKMVKQANYYANFSEAFEETTFSLNAGISFPIKSVSLGGSFSYEYESKKRNMAVSKSSVFITQLEYHVYNIFGQMGSELDPVFKERLISIDAALKNNSMVRARYLAETVIRDYGTHVISTVKAGAKIEKLDYINSEEIKSSNISTHDISAAISADFIKNFIGGEAGGGYKSDEKTIEKFLQSKRTATINSYGGLTVYNLLMKGLNKKEKDDTQYSFENLVPLDVDGMLLYKLLRENQMREIKTKRFEKIIDLLRNATKLYFQKNLYYGCMDPSSKNFNYLANVDDGTCGQPYKNSIFGGFFQKCLLQELNSEYCDAYLNRRNPITQDYKCPKNYDEILLSVPMITTSRDENLYFKMVWCTTNIDQAIREFMFGGIYAKDEINFVTGEPSCPEYYKPYEFGINVTVCLSQDYHHGRTAEVKFDGFFSCKTENQECNEGFSQQLFANYMGCDIYYCIRPEKFKQKFPEIIRPPFEDISGLPFVEVFSSNYDPDSRKTVPIPLIEDVTSKQDIDYRITRMPMLDRLSGGIFIATQIIAVFALSGFVVIVVYTLRKQNFKKYTPQISQMGYANLNRNNNNTIATEDYPITRTTTMSENINAEWINGNERVDFISQPNNTPIVPSAPSAISTISSQEDSSSSNPNPKRVGRLPPEAYATYLPRPGNVTSQKA